VGSVELPPGDDYKIVTMGSAVGTDYTAVAVPSLRVVRERNVLPYYVLIKIQ